MKINFRISAIILFSLFISYILGSFPFGYFFVKVFGGIDLQTVGSKNIGATNVWRSGYKILAVLTFLFDALKAIFAGYLGFFIIRIFKNQYSEEEKGFLVRNLPILCASFAIIGHIFSIFLNFHGGKGVSTFFGFLFFGFKNLFFYSSFIWALIFALTKISSISSLSVMIFCCFYSLFFIKDVFLKLLLIFVTIFIIFAHKKNILNLISKNELKVLSNNIAQIDK